MGPLEQAGAPDLEPMEPHGASRGSRSKGYGPLELGALNQESMGSFGFHGSWSWMESYIKNQFPREQARFLNQESTRLLWKTGPLELTGASDHQISQWAPRARGSP